MELLIKLISWTVISLTAITMGTDVFYVLSSMIGIEPFAAEVVCFRILGFLISLLLIYIYWNIYMFAKNKNFKNIRYIGLGLILESLLTCLGLFLPYNLHAHMENLNFSNMQISFTYYLATTPGSLAGIALGILLLFIAKEIEKGNILNANLPQKLNQVEN